MPWKPLPDPPRTWRSEIDQKKARFLVDEGVGSEVANVLRDLGWNAIFVGELGLLGHADEDVFAAACREDRILLTHDSDFLNDRAFRPERNPGVVVLPGGDGKQRPLLRALAATVSVIGSFRETWRGQKVVIDEEGIWTVSSRSPAGVIERTKYRFPRHGQVQQWTEEAV